MICRTLIKNVPLYSTYVHINIDTCMAHLHIYIDFDGDVDVHIHLIINKRVYVCGLMGR